MTGLRVWLARNIKWLFPFAGAIVMALKPWFLGQRYGLPEWLAAGALLASAVLVYVVPNVEAGIARYAKAFVVVALAGLGAAQQAIPDGISRADLWTIGTAVAAAAGTYLFPTSATRAVHAGGDGQMGDHRDEGTAQAGLLSQLAIIAVLLAVAILFLDVVL
jgi:hypothetical protein